MNGQFEASRGVCHIYAFGNHLIGGSDGKIYRLDPNVYLNGADPLVRERTSPHYKVPGMLRTFFSAFILDCTTGGAPQGVDPQVELSWSDNSGQTWSNPVMRSAGPVGVVLARLLWTRVGAVIGLSASGLRDRVWKVRCSANAPFSIISGLPVGTTGKN